MKEFSFDGTWTLKEALHKIYKEVGECGLEIDRKKAKVIVKTRRDLPCWKK